MASARRPPAQPNQRGRRLTGAHAGSRGIGWFAIVPQYVGHLNKVIPIGIGISRLQTIPYKSIIYVKDGPFGVHCAHPRPEQQGQLIT